MALNLGDTCQCPDSAAPKLNTHRVGEKYHSLCCRSGEEQWDNNNLRQAEKLLRKAIALKPASPQAYYLLGSLLGAVGDIAQQNEAIRHFLKGMELSDIGTAHHRLEGDNVWAHCISGACVSLDFGGTMPKPAWFTDVQQRKRLADRAAAAAPDAMNVCMMRARAYEAEDDPTAEDLRVVLRDLRLCMQYQVEGSPGWLDEQGQIRRVEKRLRLRISLDVAMAMARDEQDEETLKSRLSQIAAVNDGSVVVTSCMTSELEANIEALDMDVSSLQLCMYKE